MQRVPGGQKLPDLVTRRALELGGQETVLVSCLVQWVALYQSLSSQTSLSLLTAGMGVLGRLPHRRSLYGCTFQTLSCNYNKCVWVERVDFIIQGQPIRQPCPCWPWQRQ